MAADMDNGVIVMEESGRHDTSTMAEHFYQLGDGLRIDRKALHQEIRGFFLHNFKVWSGLSIEDMGVVVLQGGKQQHNYSSDTEILFRQDPYFHYLFGVEEPGCYAAFDLRTARSILFFERLPPEHAVWLGSIPTLDQFRAKYAVEETHWIDDMSDILNELLPPHLHRLRGVDTDSGLVLSPPTFPGIERFETEDEALFGVLAACRVFKGPRELEIMRYCARVAARAHIQLMQRVRPGMYEYQCEAAFLAAIYAEGSCRFSGYTPIMGSGPNSAILHYGHSGAPHARRLEGADLMLVDAGAEYYQYGSDLTVTFPVSGTFDDRQRVVYNAVLRALRAVEEAMCPGVAWPDMQILAEREMLAALTTAGLVCGDPGEQMEARLGALFMPHGLGHFLGKQTHDVGGYLATRFPPRPTAPGLNRLRTARALEEYMVITVEPGCYFIRALLQPQLRNGAPLRRFLVPEVLEPFLDMGGVRLEDDVVVTADGAQPLVNLPRTIQDVEAVMAGACEWRLE